MPLAPLPLEESDRIRVWRLQCLTDAGWPPDFAEELATLEVDLHDACDLLARGARPGAAFRLLVPLDYEVREDLR
jgi:hypothetical protein